MPILMKQLEVLQGLPEFCLILKKSNDTVFSLLFNLNRNSVGY